VRTTEQNGNGSVTHMLPT